MSMAERTWRNFFGQLDWKSKILIAWMLEVTKQLMYFLTKIHNFCMTLQWFLIFYLYIFVEGGRKGCDMSFSLCKVLFFLHTYIQQKSKKPCQLFSVGRYVFQWLYLTSALIQSQQIVCLIYSRSTCGIYRYHNHTSLWNNGWTPIS